MKKDENMIFSQTIKTVIFIHTANHLVIDSNIMADASYIKLAKEGLRETEGSEPYYLNEMRKAAKTDKKFIIMEFDPFICDLVERLIKTPEYNFWRWRLYIFFHADVCPPGEEPSPLYNLNDEKLGFLCPLYYSPFILKYTIPVGHILTLSDLDKMRKDFTGPETAKESRRLEMCIKKGIIPERLSFPYYEINERKMRDFIDRRLMELIRCKKMKEKAIKYLLA